MSGLHHVADLLKAAKLAAQPSGDHMLIYLIEMAMGRARERDATKAETEKK